MNFFFTASNSTQIDFTDTQVILSPAAIAGLVISIGIVLGGAIYCGWRQYRCWCPDKVTEIQIQRPIKTQVFKDKNNLEIRVIRTYPDGSVLDIDPNRSPITVMDSENEEKSVVSRTH